MRISVKTDTERTEVVTHLSFGSSAKESILKLQIEREEKNGRNEMSYVRYQLLDLQKRGFIRFDSKYYS